MNRTLNKNRNLIRHITLVVMLAASIPASAQRTMSGQSSIGLSARYNGSSVGAEAFYGMYTLGGLWDVSLSGDRYTVGISTGSRLEYYDICAKGGYLFRLLATRSRSLNLYAGGGIFAGAELLDPQGRIPSYIDLGAPQTAFLYGIYAETTLEVFLGTRCAFLLTGILPLNFSSPVSMLHYGGQVGFKILL